jgi:hypothetical protein
MLTLITWVESYHRSQPERYAVSVTPGIGAIVKRGPPASDPLSVLDGA